MLKYSYSKTTNDQLELASKVNNTSFSVEMKVSISPKNKKTSVETEVFH